MLTCWHIVYSFFCSTTEKRSSMTDCTTGNTQKIHYLAFHSKSLLNLLCRIILHMLYYKAFFTEQYIINIFTNQYRYIVLMAAENFIIERSIVYLTNLYWWICRVVILLYNNQCCHEQPYLEILPHLIVTFSYILRERIVGSNTPLHYIWNIFTSCFPKWIE